MGYKARLILICSGAFLAGILVKTFLISFHFVAASSMEPNFSPRDLVLIEAVTGNFQAGDIVIFHPPFTKNLLIKRIIALPHSEIHVGNFKVFVNGRAQEEKSVLWDKANFQCRDSEVFHTGSEEYFVMGDNRCNSADSREFGPIKKADIKGKVIWKLRL